MLFRSGAGPPRFAVAAPARLPRSSQMLPNASCATGGAGGGAGLGAGGFAQARARPFMDLSGRPAEERPMAE